MIIKWQSGYVGIGNVTTPTAFLHISGTVGSGSLLQVSSDTNQNSLFVTGSGKVGINTGTPFNQLDVVGNISCSVITASLNGTASVVDLDYLIRPVKIVMTDDWSTGMNTDGQIGALGWRMTNIAGTGTYTYVDGTDRDHPGQYKVTTSASYGAAGIFTGGSGLLSLRPTDIVPFNCYWTFQIGDRADTRFRIGLGNSATVLVPTRGMWLRYDTSGSFADTQFWAESTDAGNGTVSQSFGIAADVGWHTVRIWSTGSGVINYQLDTGSIISLANKSNNGSKMAMAYIGSNNPTASRNMTVDYFGYATAGMNR
jgi:hypothetical protein